VRRGVSLNFPQSDLVNYERHQVLAQFVMGF